MNMKNLLLTMLSIVSLSYAFGNEIKDTVRASENFLYKGQQSEIIELKWNKTGTLYRTEYRDSTCTREVPYEVYECNDVTRYREECTTVPGYNDCRTVYDNICTEIPRSRQECTRGASRQECTTGPSRENCHTIPSRERCRMVNGQRRCTTIPSRRRCNTVPGRTTCRTIPGQRSCRTVHYTETDCDSVSRQECSWVSSSQSCQDIPYTEEVCGNVTRYNTEEYACQEAYEVPYEAVVAKYTTNTKIIFSGESQQDIEFNITLNDEGKAVVKLVGDADDTDLVFENGKTSNVLEQDGISTTTEQTFSFNLKSRADYLASVKNNFSKIYLRKSSQSFGFTLDNKIEMKNFKIAFKISRKGNILVNKTLEATDERFRFTQVNEKLNAKLSLTDLWTSSRIRRVKYDVTLKLIPNEIGSILNNSKPVKMETTKSVKVKALR